MSISALNYISASVSASATAINVSQSLDKCNAETSLCVLPSVCSNGDQGTDLDEVLHAKKKREAETLGEKWAMWCPRHWTSL